MIMPRGLMQCILHRHDEVFALLAHNIMAAAAFAPAHWTAFAVLSWAIVLEAAGDALSAFFADVRFGVTDCTLHLRALFWRNSLQVAFSEIIIWPANMHVHSMPCHILVLQKQNGRSGSHRHYYKAVVTAWLHVPACMELHGLLAAFADNSLSSRSRILLSSRSSYAQLSS